MKKFKSKLNKREEVELIEDDFMQLDRFISMV